MSSAPQRAAGAGVRSERRRSARQTKARLAIAVGCIAAVAGVALTLSPAMLELDETVGLARLFALRGPLAPPEAVVVVGISRDAAAAVGQDSEVDTWPRELHADLIERLRAAGAATIVFDVIFNEPREQNADRVLAESIQRAGNVLLLEQTVTQRIDIGRGVTAEVETRRPPLPELKRGALGSAPFVLPTVPFRVWQFWTFGRASSDMPSLPALALQAFLLRYYEALLGALEAVRPGVSAPWPHSRAAVEARGDLEATMQSIRGAFRQDRQLAGAARAFVASAPIASDERAALGVLLELYDGPGTRYLNFYGPARSIVTLPFDRAVQSNPPPVELQGKAVFVGFSEPHQPEQQDRFLSIFSQRTGIDLSGVEIGATAFANLLDARAVVPLPMALSLLLVIAFGGVLGAAVGPLPTRHAATAAALAAAGYGGLAYWQFASHFLWLPLVVPLLVQVPLALGAVIWWNYRQLAVQRERVQTALGYYVPRNVVQSLAEQSIGMESSSQLLHGTCLFTDAERYTTVAESLRPDELAELMNDYYAVLFGVVERCGGAISDTAGDAMVAVWTSARPDAAMRARACAAAVEIVAAVAEFNAKHGSFELPTRVGLESGDLVLGNIGAAQRYEYRAIGDIVNTASRIQDLNRQLGTRVLVSGATLAGVVDAPATRDVGTFVLRGKRSPVQVSEPLAAAAVRLDEPALQSFGRAMTAFRAGGWSEARRLFGELASQTGDRPSAFYAALAKDYERTPPARWAGIVTIESR